LVLGDLYLVLNQQQLNLIRGSLYGSGSLSSNNVHTGSIQSNITKALSLDPTNQSLKTAQAAMQAKNYNLAKQNLQSMLGTSTAQSSIAASVNKNTTPTVTRTITTIANKIITPVVSKSNPVTLTKTERNAYNNVIVNNFTNKAGVVTDAEIKAEINAYQNAQQKYAFARVGYIPGYTVMPDGKKYLGYIEGGTYHSYA
jgi:hypothetical protein